jgi:hypothetical protein
MKLGFRVAEVINSKNGSVLQGGKISQLHHYMKSKKILPYRDLKN